MGRRNRDRDRRRVDDRRDSYYDDRNGGSRRYRDDRYADERRSYRDDYDRDRGRSDRGRVREKDEYTRSRDRKRRRSYDRRDDRDDRRRRDSERDSHREREGRSGRKRRNRKRGGGPPRPPPVPMGFHCHICGRNHWTVECNKLRASPEDYPFMDIDRGCWKCGQRGHTGAQCTVKKYHCRECGGMHSTKDCYYEHKPEEWHEFYDYNTQHAYYVNNADWNDVRWEPPTHELDVVLWYCDRCELLLPNKHDECLKCHRTRPASKSDESSSDSSSSSSDDDSSGSSDEDSSSDSSSEYSD